MNQPPQLSRTVVLQSALRKAEKAVQKILFDLEQETRMSVENVEVDTRNFAQLRTEIFLTEKQRA